MIEWDDLKRYDVQPAKTPPADPEMVLAWAMARGVHQTGYIIHRDQRSGQMTAILEIEVTSRDMDVLEATFVRVAWKWPGRTHLLVITPYDTTVAASEFFLTVDEALATVKRRHEQWLERQWVQVEKCETNIQHWQGMKEEFLDEINEESVVDWEKGRNKWP